MPEAYFIVHVAADGRRTAIKVEDWTIDLTQDADWSFGNPYTTAYPSTRRISLRGRVGDGVSFPAGDTSVFDTRPEIDAPKGELEQ